MGIRVKKQYFGGTENRDRVGLGYTAGPLTLPEPA
jgi:hypothetical protein